MAMAHGMNVFSLLAMHARGVCSLHHALGLLTECMAINYQPPWLRLQTPTLMPYGTMTTVITP